MDNLYFFDVFSFFSSYILSRVFVVLMDKGGYSAPQFRQPINIFPLVFIVWVSKVNKRDVFFHGNCLRTSMLLLRNPVRPIMESPWKGFPLVSWAFPLCGCVWRLLRLGGFSVTSLGEGRKTRRASVVIFPSHRPDQTTTISFPVFLWRNVPCSIRLWLPMASKYDGRSIMKIIHSIVMRGQQRGNVL